MTFSKQQKLAMASSRMVAGSLSLICSAIIVYKIYLRHQEHKKRNNSVATRNDTGVTVYHRFLLGMSFADILHSLAAAVGPLAVPASTGIVFGNGTTATCSAQGFFLQFGSALPLYAAGMNTYFMLKIRYNLPDSSFSKKYEPWFHACPLLLALTTAILGVSLKIFNPIAIPEMGCWVAPYPRGCSINGGCTRGFRIGELVDLYAWLFSYFWLFASLLVVVITSILTYTSIRHQERRSEQYIFSASDGPNSSQTKASSRSAVLQEPPSSPPEFVAPPDDKVAAETSEGLSGRQDPSDDKASSPQLDSSSFFSGSEQIRPEDSTFDLKRSTSISKRSKGKQVKASRVAAVQSSLYCIVIFFTAIWIFLPWLGYKMRAETKTRVFLAFMCNTMAHAQGIFNLFIFVRLQYNRLRETEREWSRLKCIGFCLSSPASNK